MSLEGFEVAVVGAGPAGSAAAITLAREGVQVLLVERGTFPGSKNVFGGRIYSYALKKLLGDSWKDAPVERFVRKEGITFMTSDNAFSVEFESKDPEGSFTAKRAKFDKWLAEQAEKAGASLITESRVDDLIIDGDRVRGIVAGQDKIPTDVVIACDGTTTGLARRAGLASMLDPGQISMGVKDVIELPSEKIEERLGLEPGQERPMSLSELAREDCEAEVSSTQTKTVSRSAWLLGETMFPHRRLTPTASWRNSENTQRCSASSREERLSNMMHI